MYCSDRIYIDKDHAVFAYADSASALASNLHNATLFVLRQHFTSHGKDHLSANQTEVEENLKLVEEQVKHHAGRVVGYEMLDKYMRITKNPDYFADGLSKQAAQGILKHTVNDFKNWLKALKAYQINPAAFTGRPKMPHYCKSKRSSIYFTNQDVSITVDGAKLPLCKSKVQVYRRKNARLKSAQLKPENRSTYVFLLTYEMPDSNIKSEGISCSVDFGVNNLISAVTEKGDSIIFKGGAFKWKNHRFNSNKAALVSALTTGKKTSSYTQTARLERLSLHRSAFFFDGFHKVTNLFIKWCEIHHVNRIVLGSTPFWKQNADIGKVNNQNFVQMPFDQLKGMIDYKAANEGIAVEYQEESYTSKADFFAGDAIPTYGKTDEQPKFSGRRIQRGLYRSKGGTIVNADLNGALNILRKSGTNTSIRPYQLRAPQIVNYPDLNNPYLFQKLLVSR
jgi:putative transposase